jgi:hypothetical protein
MKIDLFLTADYANITGDGKLNVMGIFREIHASTFPARHSSMHLVLRLTAELGEYGVTRDLFIKLLTADGSEVMSFSGKINVPMGKGGIIPQVNVIIELKDLVFPQPGSYQFIVLVDKDYKGDLPLYVYKIETPSQS